MGIPAHGMFLNYGGVSMSEFEKSRRVKVIEEIATSVADRIPPNVREVIRDAFIIGLDRDAITILIDEIGLVTTEKDRINRRTVVPVKAEMLIRGGSIATVTARPQVPFRPWYFQIAESCANHFDIANIMIGNWCEFVTNADIDGKRFIREYPLSQGRHFQLGMDLRVDIRNKIMSEDHDFSGYFIGEQLRNDY